MAVAALLAGRFGLEPDLLAFSLRTALSSWFALVIALALGIPSPHWAAMTVWFVAQQDSGAVVEKSLFRILGTFVGAQVGAVIVWLASGDQLLMTIGLMLWIPLCAGLGNLLRHFFSYGALLAGATTAIVVLQGFRQPEHIFDLDLARVSTICIGIAVAVVSTLFSSRRTPSINLEARVRGLREKALLTVAATLVDQSYRKVRTMRFALLEEIAELEDALDNLASGSPRAHRRNRPIRTLLIALLALLSIAKALRKLWEPKHSNGTEDRLPGLRHKQLAELILRTYRERTTQSLCREIEKGDPEKNLRGYLFTEMARTFATIDQALSVAASDDIPDGTPTWIMLHRDWLGAREAALRALLAIGVAGAFWWYSDWVSGNLMLMGVCMFVILFSTLDNPLLILRGIVIGAASGGVLAICVRELVFPLCPSVIFFVVCTAMICLVGAVLVTHPKTRFFGADLVFCFLLIAQPGVLSLTLAQDVYWCALALFVGVLTSYLAFFLFPRASSRRRIGWIGLMMVRDLQKMIAVRPFNGELWHQRTLHRVLRMVRLTSVQKIDSEQTVEGCLTVLSLGRAVLLIDRILSEAKAPQWLLEKVWNAIRSMQSLPEMPEVVLENLKGVSLEIETISTAENNPEGLITDDLAAELIEILREMASMLELQKRFFQVDCS